MATILDISQYTLIYRVSYLFLFTSMYGIHRNQGIESAIPFSVFLTSTLYWNNPDYSWRLYLDVCVVRCMILCQVILAYNRQNSMPFYLIFGTGLASYPIGRYYFAKEEYWMYVYFHICTHILTNIGTIVLYSGPPRS
jgi:hypothetical protein